MTLIKTNIINIYKEALKYEPIYLQKYSNGFHTKRLRCETIQEIQEAHLRGYNHRKIFMNCLIWDIDCHLRVLSQRIWQDVSFNLRKEDISHFVWDTSRSFHIHALFRGLERYCKDDRKKIKLLLLAHYAKQHFMWCDKNMVNENMNIRDFYGLHEITGKKKEIIFEFKDKWLVNPINPDILGLFRQEYKSLNSVLIVNCGASVGLPEALQQSYKSFLEFAQITPFLRQGMQKNNLYFKNIAIAVYRLQIAEKEARQIFKNVAMQCKPHKSENMTNWLKWVKQQKHEVRVNWGEIRGFYNDR